MTLYQSSTRKLPSEASNLHVPNKLTNHRRHSVLENTLIKRHETRHDYMRSIVEAENNVKI